MNTIRSITPKNTKIQFKEFYNTGIFISETCSKTYLQSQKILENNNLRFMTLTETLSSLLKNEELKTKLKEKTFFISDKGTNLSYYYSLISENTIKKGKGEIEKTLFAYEGTSQLSFHVGGDYYTNFYESRYVLNGNTPQNYKANIIIGVKSDKEVINKLNISFNDDLSFSQTENKTEFNSLYSAALADVLRLGNVIGTKKISNILKFLKFLKK